MLGIAFQVTVPLSAVFKGVFVLWSMGKNACWAHGIFFATVPQVTTGENQCTAILLVRYPVLIIIRRWVSNTIFYLCHRIKGFVFLAGDMQCLVNRAACRFSWPLDQHIFSSSSSLLPKPADPSESAHRMEDMQAGREGHVWLEHKITFRHFHFASHMFFISCFYVPSQKYIKKKKHVTT